MGIVLGREDPFFVIFLRVAGDILVAPPHGNVIDLFSIGLINNASNFLGANLSFVMPMYR